MVTVAVRKLKEESATRDQALEATISKIEAPIGAMSAMCVRRAPVCSRMAAAVGITAALANIIASPDLKDTPLKVRIRIMLLRSAVSLS